MRPKIYVGSDHTGVELKQLIIDHLGDLGYEVENFGTNSTEAYDYPLVAIKVSQSVSEDVESRRGILICATGVGVCMVANRIPKILAGQVWTPAMAERARNDDNLNVLCLADSFLDRDLSLEIVDRWLTTDFSGEERHRRRLAEIARLDS